MIFQKESIEAILAGRKTMTRRLVKEGEFLHEIYLCGKDITSVIKDLKNRNKKGNIVSRYKWQVGRKYAVCPGRGKPQVWTDGKDFVSFIDNNEKLTISFKKLGFKPLFVEVTGIRKEKLLYLTEEDAKREGFLTKAHFIETFYKINKIKYKTLVDEKLSKFLNQPESFIAKKNPEVWVISFKVV
jgi:hypothetical protein